VPLIALYFTWPRAHVITCSRQPSLRSNFITFDAILPIVLRTLSLILCNVLRCNELRVCTRYDVKCTWVNPANSLRYLARWSVSVSRKYQRNTPFVWSNLSTCYSDFLTIRNLLVRSSSICQYLYNRRGDVWVISRIIFFSRIKYTRPSIQIWWLCVVPIQGAINVAPCARKVQLTQCRLCAKCN